MARAMNDRSGWPLAALLALAPWGTSAFAAGTGTASASATASESSSASASAESGAGEIIVGDEEIVVGDERVETGEGHIEINGETYEVPEISDLPVNIEPAEDGFRISIGDEHTEATPGAGRPWEGGTDTPYRISFGHDVYVAPEELVEGDIWSIGGDVTIAGTVDGEVIAFAGNVDVEGEVYGDVVALFGGIDMDRAAICGGDVVAFGGNVNQNRAHVDGEALSFRFLPGTDGVPELESALLVCAAASLVLFGAFALILTFIFRSNTERMLGEIRSRPFHAFWVGFALQALGPLVLFLLLVTVIGAPLALLGWLLWWGVAQSGVVLGAVRLGQAILRRPAVREVLPGAIVGGLLLHVPFILGILAYMRGGPGVQTAGLTLLTIATGLAGVLTLTGMGAVISTRFGEGATDGGADVGSTPLFEPMGGSDGAS